MAGLSIRNICKTYAGGVVAVKDFNQEIENREFVVLVGPSGCGKSTTLRMIAGLEEISSGELYIDGKLVNDEPPRSRDIAMVFQNYALYPHMSVYANMAFGLKMRNISKAEIHRRVLNAARLLEIEPYLERRPKALSGGQRQRVALGRAMVRNPAVFLLDEPLSNLDAKLRVQMRSEIVKLHQRLGTTFIYVTHDQTEAMTMGTRIIVMKDGVVQQADTPRNLYDHPCNKFVAEFIGSPQMNMFTAELAGTGERVTVNFDSHSLVLSGETAERLAPYRGRKVRLGIRPEGFAEAPRTGDDSRIEVTADLVETTGSDVYVFFNAPSCPRSISARLTPRVAVRSGDRLPLYVGAEALHFFDLESGASLFGC